MFLRHKLIKIFVILAYLNLKHNYLPKLIKSTIIIHFRNENEKKNIL